MAIYYDPLKEAPLLGPEIITILNYLPFYFKKTTINIVTKEDLAPLTLPLCGDDRNKVIAFELWIGKHKKTQRTVKKKKTKIQVSGTRRAFKRISRIFVQPEQGSRASFFGLQRKRFKIEKLTILWLGYGLGV